MMQMEMSELWKKYLPISSFFTRKSLLPLQRFPHLLFYSHFLSASIRGIALRELLSLFFFFFNPSPLITRAVIRLAANHLLPSLDLLIFPDFHGGSTITFFFFVLFLFPFILIS